MKTFDLDFQFGTSVLPESDGENIIKYKNGYVYKEIFLPLNYQEVIGKMLIKTKFTEDISVMIQKVTTINDFIYNNGVSDKEPFVIPTYDLVVNASGDMSCLVDEIHSAYSTSYNNSPVLEKLVSFSKIIETTNFKDLDEAYRDIVSEETSFESLFKFTHDLPLETLDKENTQKSLKVFIKLLNTYMKALKNTKDKEFYFEVSLKNPNPFQYMNIIQARRVKFIKDTLCNLSSQRIKLRKEIASEANEAKLVEVQTNYKKFIKKLSELNPVTKTTSVRKSPTRTQKTLVKKDEKSTSV